MQINITCKVRVYSLSFVKLPEPIVFPIIIDEALAVSADDYNDSINILNWNNDLLAVSKSHSGNRMNEQKVHNNWAKKIIMRSAIYGIKEECREKKFERATMKIKDHS